MAELAEVIGGLAPNYVLDEGAEGLTMPVASVADLSDGRVAATRDMRTATLADSDQVRARQLRVGDVVIAARGAAFKAALVHSDAAGSVASGNLIVLRPNGVLLPAVLLALLTSSVYEAKLAELSRGTGRVLSLSIKDVSQVELPVPPMPTQQALADLAEARRQEAEAAAIVTQQRDSLYRAAMDRALFPPRGDDQ